MKVFLRRRLNVFPKLRRRLSSVKWILLVATTAMFFLSTFSSACDGLTVTFGPIGPSVLGGSPPGTQPALTTMPSVSPLTGGGTPAPGSVALGGGTPPSLAAGGGTPPSLAVGGGTPPSLAMGGGTPPATGPGTSSTGPGTPPTGPGNPPAGPGGTMHMVTMDKSKTPIPGDPTGFIFVDSVNKSDPKKFNETDIKKGTTVVWTNPTTAPHTVTADDMSFDSGDFEPNAKPFSFTFNKTGTFTYHCDDHAGQVGTVVVS